MSKIHLFHVIVSAVTYNFFAVLIVGSFQYGSWLARAAKPTWRALPAIFGWLSLICFGIAIGAAPGSLEWPGVRVTPDDPLSPMTTDDVKLCDDWLRYLLRFAPPAVVGYFWTRRHDAARRPPPEADASV